ncbi:ubiquitin-conjugating enzyme E22 [Trichinella spiralis]|uniref:ubiquitin-conjugating enzyme E22 n=1 Tax=Trichinella spiralis TaxID=6334 RepID=UPI0001EFEF28|nr:ubiquitin-conjugating enzyme E22 [Trichinella spiralis]
MLSTSRAHFAHIAVLDYSRQCRNNRVQAGKTRSIRSPWRAKKTRLPAADACSPNADWTAMLACFINSACLFCSASFIGPAALDAPWAFLAMSISSTLNLAS